MSIPVIDTRVKYVGASALRSLNAKALRELEDVLVVQVDEKPVAVIVPYDLYMRMQDEIWPSSLLPALEKFLGQVFEGGESNGGADGSPDMEHSTPPSRNHSVAEGSVPMRTESGHVYRRGERHPCGVPDCPANSFPAKIDLSVIGVTNEPRGAKLARVDDSRPPVIDDVDGDSEAKPLTQRLAEAQTQYVEGAIKDSERLQSPQLSGSEPFEVSIALAQSRPVCAHCGKVSGKDLCSDCFLAGHRSGNCLVCAEGAK